MNIGEKQWELKVSLEIGGGYRNAMLTKASNPRELKYSIDSLIQALQEWAERIDPNG